MAPSADILVANGNGNAQVLDAIAWMKAKAAALGRPLVINMSFGSYFGARDGTSNYEQGMSDARRSRRHPGGAAGNEATAPIRATGTIAQGGERHRRLRHPRRQHRRRTRDLVSGHERYGVNVAGPGCAATVTVNPGETPEPATRLRHRGVLSTGVQPNNDDRQIKVAHRLQRQHAAGQGCLEDHAGGHRRRRRQPAVLDHQRRGRHRAHVHRSHLAGEHRDPDRHVELPSRDRRGVVQHAQRLGQPRRARLGHFVRRACPTSPTSAAAARGAIAAIRPSARRS